MEVQAFSLLKDAEQSWWYRARARAVERMFSSFRSLRGKVAPADVRAPGPKLRILDVGAGWGGMFDTLRQFGDVSAYEPYPEAAEQCKDKGYVRLALSLDSLEKQGARFDAAGAFDVLEHIEDDADTVRRVGALLPSGGLFVATVPAFMFLWSKHDVTHKHFRRYSVRAARELFEQNGFEVAYVSHWNFLLFPLALLMRFVGLTGESSLRAGGIKDRLLGAIACFETGLMPRVRYPWGTGLVIVARKR